MSLEDIRNERVKKLERIRSWGKNPYPAKTGRTHLVNEVLSKFSGLAKSKKKVRVTGRLMAKREHGGSAFFDLKDEAGKIQLFFKKDVLGDDYERAIEVLDIGDFLEAEGKLFKTKKGEETIEISDWVVLVKSLRPLPEKWHGLQDVEERFRKRYLDLLINPEVKDRFEKRLALVWTLRNKLAKEGFIEVETPILQVLPGGARARPFVTHYNALDMDFYLRVAPELYLKRLLIGGFGKVFEIARNFRNEGIDHDHNPEFTMLELYWVYQDYRGLMVFLEKMLKEWLPGPWKKVTFAEAIKSIGKKDWKNIPGEELDIFYKKEVRSKIQEPTLVIDYPESIMQLAKPKAEDPTLTESFQLLVQGTELVKGFSELNDPIFQRRQMERQEELYRAGDKEATRLDEDFLEALEYGMPPSAGLGIGIDRLVMLATGTKNVREAVLFPTLRPK